VLAYFEKWLGQDHACIHSSRSLHERSKACCNNNDPKQECRRQLGGLHSRAVRQHLRLRASQHHQTATLLAASIVVAGGSFRASGAWTTQRNGRSASRKPLVTSRISSGSRSVRRATRRHGLDQSRCWRAFGWSTETAAEDVVEGEGRGRGTRRGRGSRAGVRRHGEVFPMQIWWTRWV
jgi:hypothetical protein